VVIEVGGRIVESRDASTMRRDILLSMALAKLGQAEYFFSVPNQVWPRGGFGSERGVVGGDGMYEDGRGPSVAD